MPKSRLFNFLAKPGYIWQHCPPPLSHSRKRNEIYLYEDNSLKYFIVSDCEAGSEWDLARVPRLDCINMPGESDPSYKLAAKLILDEPRSIYYSGQVLNGHIECELTQPFSYTVINVNFIGAANVFWTETESEEYNGVQRNLKVAYRAQETYFNTMLHVSGGMGVTSLPPGNHQVPFQFQIPHSAPSSFRGKRGSVSYKVVAYIEYPDPTKNRDQLEKEFEVVAPLDLNMGDDIKMPIDLEFDEVFTCCCCTSNPMSVVIHLPASGFCPGQAIPITVVADNKSDVEVNKIIFQLIQKECYHSTEPKSDYIPPEKVLVTIKTGPRLGRTRKENMYELMVPDFIAPNLQNCKIIDIGYFIKVTIKLSGCNDDLEDENEICLGLVPLAFLVENYTHPMKSDLPQAAIPDPNFILPPPVQNVQYQTSAPIQNSAAYPTASSYPNSGEPFPNVTPYPPDVTPYPPKEAPYPTHEAPYPTNASPYPPTSAPYPSSDNHPQPGILMTSLRTGTIGFMAGTNSLSHHEANTGPYPGAHSSFPGANPPYPGANPPYPGANPPYPGANPPYPEANPPYPGANSAPYPTEQAGHPSFSPHYAASAPSAPPS